MPETNATTVVADREESDLDLDLDLDLDPEFDLPEDYEPSAAHIRASVCPTTCY